MTVDSAPAGQRGRGARVSIIAEHPVWIAAYPVTIFAAAFLLFQIEPMMAKFMLPWFGGAQSVWTTCILFFQLLLLGGYTYAHLIGTHLTPRRQAAVHLALVAVCVALMTALALAWRSPIMPPPGWKPADPALPVLRILMILSAGVGLPYFILSATAPLLQSWFARSYQVSSPYRLYALSNLGAMLGLVSYPFVVEPALSLRWQARSWYLLYIVFALSLAACAFRLRALKPPLIHDEEGGGAGADPLVYDAAPAPAARFFWVALSACASLLFLAVTNQLCEDVAPVPFLWVLPLAIYLLSFIVCFGNEHWYRRAIFNPALAVAIVLACAVLYRPFTRIVWQAVIYSLLVACACMVCHGELVRLKPSKSRLTGFYLMVSAGGALGGLFGAVAAPLIFRGYWELQVSIWGCAALLLAVLMREPGSWIHQRRPVLAIALLAGAVLPELMLLSAGKSAFGLSYNLAAAAVLVLGSATAFRSRESAPGDRAPALVAVSAAAVLLILGSVLLSNVTARAANSLIARRNFYGAFAVVASDANDPAWHSYVLRHGRIVHGVQFPQPDKRRQPTSYYGPGSGVGLLMLHPPYRQAAGAVAHPLRVGVVGLGVGTIATYGRPGDYIRFYEINPAIIQVATDPNGYFSFLRDSRARVDIIAGDGRLSMEREAAGGHAQRFDILVIDAFSGDSIPVHLLTREAFAVYLSELAGDGVLALHITNGYLDLRPVIKQLAHNYNLFSGWAHSEPTGRLTAVSDWVLLARNTRVLGQPAIAANLKPLNDTPGVRMWTDDYSNLFRILR
ncbi:MAG TPA: hypothetical protein VN754_00155 [Candidatus Binataceae bacterium]|nr:hypothetical protein [Candidatus Binataceae bacterium]